MRQDAGVRRYDQREHGSGLPGLPAGLRRVAVVPRPHSVKPALTAIRRQDAVENPEFAAFAERILRAAARRVADGDVEGLAALVALRFELDAATANAVAGLRQPKWSYSWSEIARVLGTTRQAAQQRYGSKACS